MSLFTPERPLPAALGAALFGAGLLASVLASVPRPAHAAVSCRVDPIVTLSNGAVMHLGAAIADNASDITAVSYALHAPIGTRVVGVVYPSDARAIRQTFRFYPDNAPSTWDVYTYVDSKTHGVGVTATVEVNNRRTFTAAGVDHQKIRVHMGHTVGTRRPVR